MRDHILPVLESLDWLGVRDLVVRRDCIGVFRALSDPQAPLAIRSLFSRRVDVPQRATRATVAGELELPALRLSLSRRMFSYRAASSWNRLPPATTTSRTRNEFVRRLSADVHCWYCAFISFCANVHFLLFKLLTVIICRACFTV